MTHLLPSTCISVVFLALLQPVREQDEDGTVIGSKLQDAAKVYLVAVTEAEQQFVESIDSQIRKLRTNQRIPVETKITELERLESSKAEFEKHGTISKNPKLKLAAAKLQRSFAIANKNLTSAYRHAAEAYGKIGDLDSAKQILEQLKGFEGKRQRLIKGSRGLGFSILNVAVAGDKRSAFAPSSIPNILVAGSPNDTDKARWATLHDGADFRLYFMKAGDDTKLYSFAFNTAASQFVWGYNSIPEVDIVGIPSDADTGSFAMLHDGEVFRLYFRSRSRANRLHQFGFNDKTRRFEYGFSAIPQITVAGAPKDSDWSRWGLLHDGTDYRLFCGRKNKSNEIHQFIFDTSADTVRYNFESTHVIHIEELPTNSDHRQFAAMHDGTNFLFFFQTH